MTRLRYTETDLITKHFTFEYYIKKGLEKKIQHHIEKVMTNEFANALKH